MHVILVTPEVSPYSGDSDLAELCASLPAALCQQELQVTVITPFYQVIDPSRHGLARRLLRFPVKVGAEELEVGLIDGKFQASDVSLLMVDHPESFDRPGLYSDPEGPYRDNTRRLHIFCSAVAGMIRELDLKPDMVHAMGWQAGLLPGALARQAATRDLPVVLSINDDRAPGLVPAADLEALGVEDQGLASDGQVSLLELGASAATLVLGRGPSHARALARDEAGPLHRLFAGLGRRLTGVLPGVDPALWNPAQNHRLPHHFERGSLAGKADCKLALQQELGLTVDEDRPLLALTALDGEAGLDLLLQGAGSFPPAERYQLIIAGALPGGVDVSGLLEANPGAVAHKQGPGEADLHRILAGADGHVLPRRRELDLLLALKGMSYGAAPLTRAVGAMTDAVVNYDADTGTGTGVTFTGDSGEDFTAALRRFVTLLASHNHRQNLAQNAMSHPFTWDHTARLHRAVYERAVASLA